MRWLISIEKAKALKDAGLRWVAKGGDCYFYANGEFTGDFIIKSDPGEPVVRQMDCQIWLPRLDQLLTEIEKRRYRGMWSAGKCHDGKYFVCLYPVKLFHGDTPEDVVADALLWILRQERK
ncbi:MAG TPA: hypothetical protein DCZ10_16065 [Pelotomaculum sp.]|nr:hypothetical protein [Pelotomaculum sp.]